MMKILISPPPILRNINRVLLCVGLTLAAAACGDDYDDTAG